MHATNPDRLNLGCGYDVRVGWVNLDSAALPGVDVVHDIGTLPLPFADGEFREIVCQDVLEHVELIPVLRDLHRILTPGGLLRIRVPHFTSRNFYVDPTHRTAFSIDTLRFFLFEDVFERSYYFNFAFARAPSARITFFRSTFQPWNPMIERVVNRSPRMQRYYEATFLAGIFPALNVEFTLVK